MELPMRLADFIRANKTPIIAEWENFAGTLTPAVNMTAAQLRDHIEQILSFIAADLESPQSAGQQLKKSHGKSDSENDTDSAAEIHGTIRHDEGFDIVQMVSEYRALRSSVIKLWTNSNRTLSDSDVVDLVRFNEAIDQALAESVVKFTIKVEYTKDLFLGILGHDIRSPLGAMKMCAQLIPRTGAINDKQAQFVAQIVECGRRISDIVGNLLDFTRARIGTGLPVLRAPMDMGVLARQVVGEMQIQHPERSILLEAAGDMEGEWDATRIGQLFSNLIGNAIQYGEKSLPINILLDGDDQRITIAVHNSGEPIPPRQLHTLFHSFTRGKNGGPAAESSTANLGLGLFITKEIAAAHGGSIKVVSNEKDGTTFTVQLPKSMCAHN
jgi:signal transduction histidine kinase